MKLLTQEKCLIFTPDSFSWHQDVTVIYNPSDRNSNYKTATELSTICFFGGDEISRQQYRR